MYHEVRTCPFCYKSIPSLDISRANFKDSLNVGYATSRRTKRFGYVRTYFHIDCYRQNTRGFLKERRESGESVSEKARGEG